MIAIIGAGGHAKSVYDCFYQQGLEVFGFFDDDPLKKGIIVINKLKVVGTPDLISDYQEIKSVFVAVGDNRLRLEKYSKYANLGFNMPNAIHGRACISDFATIGDGTFLMGAAMINPGSKIGNCCIINTSATVGHDCLLEDTVQLGPGVNIAGGAVIRSGAFIGIGAKVGPGITIGAWSVVGAGAVVLEDVPGGVFCCGVPARVVKETPSPRPSPLEGEGD